MLIFQRSSSIMFLSTNESGEKKAVVEQLHDRSEKDGEA